MIGIEGSVVISHRAWPNSAIIAPGDLTQYAPIGLGMTAPMVVMPWDDLGDVLRRNAPYGSNPHTGDPIRDAPVNDRAGGIVYFDNHFETQQLATVLRFLAVSFESTRYAVFAAESTNPQSDRYLAQIRIVAPGAMRLFGASTDPEDAAYAQELSVGASIAAFINAQRKMWGDGASGAIVGTLGGDGDYATEKLAFGFMVENALNGVYRLWSRPWLLTK